jgi:hypothetical protein
MEFNEETKDSETSEEMSQSKVKIWFQDNLRILISVIIVVLIAGGIYSYSNRSQAPTGSEDMDEAIITEEIDEDDQEIAQGQASEEGKISQKPAGQAAPNSISAAASSQETETAFIQTAGSGDSRTVLARAALANYLEKNADSSLTAEHKIYIEDYLQKKVDFSGRVFIGTSVEFSKSLIQDAITQSKNLTENQLNNLHQYSVRVPSLS